MERSWPNQGAMPPPNDSSRSKQEARRHPKRLEREVTSEGTAIVSVPRTPYAERRGSTSSQPRTNTTLADGSNRYGSTAFPEAYRTAGIPSISSYAQQTQQVGSVRKAAQASGFANVQNARTSQSYAQGGASAAQSNQLSQSDEVATTSQKFDEKSGVRTVVVIGPPEKITARELQQQGILVHSSIVESRQVSKGTGTGNDDRSTPKYKIEAGTKKSFKAGNVIEIRYVQPDRGGTTVTHSPRRDVGHSRMRRFVVIREGSAQSALLSISTLGGRGVAIPGTIKANYSVIYTGDEVPTLLPGEEPTRTESGPDLLRHPPIKVWAKDRAQKLDSHSRLHYGKIYQFAHDRCEIIVFGHVVDGSMQHLLGHFNAVQRNLPQPYRIDPGERLMNQRPYGGPTLGQPGPSHGRVDSVQQRPTPRDVLKDPREEDERTGHQAGRSDTQDIRSIPMRDLSLSGSNVTPSAQQMAALNDRAQSLRVDLRGVPDTDRVNLAQMSVANQGRTLMDLLRRQNPRSHAQIVARMQAQAAAARSRTERQSDGDDIDDEDDEENEDEESSDE